MRVRIYEVGESRSVGVHYLDEFPCTLNVDAQGGLTAVGTPVCRLENLGGEILYKSLTEKVSMSVNNAPLESGPLEPGDRLSFGSRRFMISYERTATQTSSFPKYRLQKS